MTKVIGVGVLNILGTYMYAVALQYFFTHPASAPVQYLCAGLYTFTALILIATWGVWLELVRTGGK